MKQKLALRVLFVILAMGLSVSFRLIYENLGQFWYSVYWDLIILTLLNWSFWHKKKIAITSSLIIITTLLAITVFFEVGFNGIPVSIQLFR